MFKLYFAKLLNPILHSYADEEAEIDNYIQTDGSKDADDDGDGEEGQEKQREKAGDEQSIKANDFLLDLTGPKLFEGCSRWIYIYAALGQVNIPKLPAYLSLLFKLTIGFFSCFVLFKHYFTPVWNSGLLDGCLKNPIFKFIGIFSIVFSSVNSTAIFWNNMWYLCPLFKILTTPRLCFIKTSLQLRIANLTSVWLLMILLYHTLLIEMFVCKDLASFLISFNPLQFMGDSYATGALALYLFGPFQMDYYIRSCFGFWLLASKSNLNLRLSRFHKLKQRMDASLSEHSVECQQQQQQQQAATIQKFRQIYNYFSLDELQTYLNNMDDHLEVWRCSQSNTIVFIAISAFNVNGALFMMAYSFIAQQQDLYHGTLIVLIGLNYAVLVFICYFGDSWLYYTLKSFVQTVEDEYFLQGGHGEQLQLEQRYLGSLLNELNESKLLGGTNNKSSRTRAEAYNWLNSEEREFLLIKRQDVMFCREFLVQFEDHIATPWAKLSVKSHMIMIRTFVTLVAAQIIFDHEHDQ